MSWSTMHFKTYAPPASKASGAMSWKTDPQKLSKSMALNSSALAPVRRAILQVAHNMRSCREPFGADLNHRTISSFVIFAILEPVSAPWVAAHRKAVHWFGYRRGWSCKTHSGRVLVSRRAARQHQGPEGVIRNVIASIIRAIAIMTNAVDTNRILGSPRQVGV